MRRRWFSAREVASARLAGWPHTATNMSKRFTELRSEKRRLFRKRKARGGGWEISIDAFTPAERKALAKAPRAAKELAAKLAEFNPDKRGYSGEFDWFTARELADCGSPDLPADLRGMVAYLNALEKRKPAYFRREWRVREVHIKALPAGTCNYVERRAGDPAPLAQIAATLPRMWHDRSAAYFELHRRAILHSDEGPEQRRTLLRLLFVEILLRYTTRAGIASDSDIADMIGGVAYWISRRAAVARWLDLDVLDLPPHAPFIDRFTLGSIASYCRWVGHGVSWRPLKRTLIQFATELQVPPRHLAIRALVSAYNCKEPTPLDALLSLRRQGFITGVPLTRRQFFCNGWSPERVYPVSLHLDLAGPATGPHVRAIPLDLRISDWTTEEFLSRLTLFH